MTSRRPPEAPAPVHSDEAHRVITVELVRRTLARPTLAMVNEARILAWETMGEGMRGTLAALAGLTAAHVATALLLRGER